MLLCVTGFTATSVDVRSIILRARLALARRCSGDIRKNRALSAPAAVRFQVIKAAERVVETCAPPSLPEGHLSYFLSNDPTMRFLLLLITLAVPTLTLSTPPQPRSPQGLHIPLTRRGPILARDWDGNADMDVLFTMMNCTRVKYNYTSPEDCSTMLPVNSTSRRSLLPRQSQNNASLIDQVNGYLPLATLSTWLTIVACRVKTCLITPQSISALRELYLLESRVYN